MEKGKVLVIGNSGVGKSTLINAVVGKELARTGDTKYGTTKNLQVYQEEALSFDLIDTVGFENSFLQEIKARQQVKKWSEAGAKRGNETQQINMIWFCVDANEISDETGTKFYDHAIKNLNKTISTWNSVPVIIVLTKSFDMDDVEADVERIRYVVEEQTRIADKIMEVVPVVAEGYEMDENTYVNSFGVDELTELTDELMPLGLEAGKKDLAAFQMKRRRMHAQSIVARYVTAGVLVGAIPIPIPDAMILEPTEIKLVNALAKNYEIPKDKYSKKLFLAIIEVGTAGVAAKAAINALKAIPGINLGASALNAIIAGAIVGAIGEGSILAFEKIYTGERKVTDVDWITEVIEDKLTKGFLEKVNEIIQATGDGSDKKKIAKLVKKTFIKKNSN